MTRWKTEPLRDLGAWTGGGTPSKSRPEYWDNGSVPWLSPKDMGPDVLQGTRDHITDAAVRGSATRVVKPGSVAVVVRSGILERKLPVALVPFATTLNQDMKAIECRPDVDPRWVAWGLRANERELLRAARKAGTTVASLEWPRFLDWRLPVPPLEEQRRIVDILEDHLSRLDAANDYLDASLARVNAWRQAAVDAEFFERIREGVDDRSEKSLAEERQRTGVGGAIGTPRLPDTELLTAKPWPVVSLEAATSSHRVIRYGILKPRVKAPGTVPYVEVKDLAGYSLEGKSLHRTSAELDSQFHGARLAEGDVVIAVRGSYERTAVVPSGMSGANISRDVARIAPLPSLNPDFLWWWLQSSLVKRYLRRHARGVAVKGVNISTLRALPVPAVQMAIQLRLVDRLADVAKASTRISTQVSAARERSDLLRRMLLVAAFSGRLTDRSTNLGFADELVAAEQNAAAATRQFVLATQQTPNDMAV